jgi:hypothetical protein
MFFCSDVWKRKSLYIYIYIYIYIYKLDRKRVFNILYRKHNFEYWIRKKEKDRKISTIRKRKKKTPQKAHTRESEKKVKRETRIQKHYIKNI